MRKLLFILVLASTPAWAEWTCLGHDVVHSYEFCVDLATIHKRGDLVKIWTLLDYTASKQSPRGRAYLSQKAQHEFDCDGDRSRLIFVSQHSGNMGGGETVYSDGNPETWKPIPPESVLESIRNVACKR